jgi:ADP-ribose pyrophosphatase YjhB (NUDIX family)
MENNILDLFLFNHKMKFNEIEKALNIRSNKLVYHLKNLIKKQIIEKQDEFYSLSETAEILIPYISNKNPVLPIVIIHIGDDKKCFLWKRNKRPYKELLSLPGGRLILGENLKQAVKRIMKEKFNMNARLKHIHSISLEHIRKKNKIIHSFLLIFVSASSNEIKLTDIGKNKKHIIKSDFFLIKNHLNKKLDIGVINSR